MKTTCLRATTVSVRVAVKSLSAPLAIKGHRSFFWIGRSPIQASHARNRPIPITGRSISASVTNLVALPTHWLYISLGLPLSHCRVLFCHYLDLWAFSLCVCPVDYLDCLIVSDRLLPTSLTLPAFWIFSLSAAFPDLCIVPAYVPALSMLL